MEVVWAKYVTSILVLYLLLTRFSLVMLVLNWIWVKCLVKEHAERLARLERDAPEITTKPTVVAGKEETIRVEKESTGIEKESINVEKEI